MVAITIDSIDIGERHRKDMGDLSGLIKSIEEIGLLQPIVITPDLRLIAGSRRIAAYRKLGRDEIEAHVIDLDNLLSGERDENTVRKDFTPSEAVAIGRAIEERERERAAQRKAATQAKPGEGRVGADKLSAPVAEGRVRDIVGAAVGMSGGTYEEAKAVVAAAEADPTLQPIVEEMDRTGRVNPARRKLRELQNGHTPPTVDKSREGTSQRHQRIQQLGREGHRVEDIAAREGVGPESVTKVLSAAGIPTVAQKIGKFRTIDTNSVFDGIVNSSIPSAEAVAIVLGDWESLDRLSFGKWESQLTDAIKTLTMLRNKVRND